MKAWIVGVVFCLLYGSAAGIHSFDPRFPAGTEEANIILEHCDTITIVGSIFIAAVAVLFRTGGVAFLISIPAYGYVAYSSARFMYRPMNEIPPALIELAQNALTWIDVHVI